MSTRANAARYTPTNNASGILPFIGNVLGGNATTGGVEVAPDGSYKFSPMKAKHPLMDRIFSRGEAGDRAQQTNIAVLMQQYIEQEAQKRAIALAQEEAKLRAEQDKAKYGRDVELENLRAANTKSSDLNRIGAEAASKYGVVPYASSEVELAGKAMNDIMLRNQLAQQVQTGEDLANPQIREAGIANKVATDWEKAVANWDKMKVSVSPLQTQYTPKFGMVPQDPTTGNKFVGATPEQSIEVQTDMLGNPVKTNTKTSYAPSTVNPRAAQSLLDAAGRLNPGGVEVSAPPQNNSEIVNEFLRRMLQPSTNIGASIFSGGY